MLHPERAREALEKFRIDDWARQRLPAVAELPGEMGHAGRALLVLDDKGRPLTEYSARANAHVEAAATLEKLPPAQRRRVFAAVFPRLAPHLDAGWELTRRVPYQMGYAARRAFRAPSRPGASRGTRASWLCGLLTAVSGYDPDAAWLAAWAPYLGGGHPANCVGLLLAAVIDAGGADGDAVFDILCASARGERDTGGMGRHVTSALLVAGRPEGWELVEKLLLAAQRQEGLRQSILETIDEAHPEAFRRMLRLIQEHDLVRFSAVVRAVNVWFGFQWDSVSVRVANAVLERVLRYLEDAGERDAALAGDDPESAYLALCTVAFTDAVAAVGPAARLLADRSAERRFVAAYLLSQLHLPEAQRELCRALEDADLRVAWQAFLGCLPNLQTQDDDGGAAVAELVYDSLERFVGRVPEREETKPIVWPWCRFTVERRTVASQLVHRLGDRPPTRLLPHLPRMRVWDRARVIGLLGEMKKWDAATRDTLFALVGDPSSYVREAAIKALASCKVSENEAQRLEGLLTRKAADLRRGAVTLLLTQKDPVALASADRLLASSSGPQRLAGMELLRQLAEANRAAGECRRRADAYRSRRPRLSDEEQEQLNALLSPAQDTPTLDDALGLLDPADRTEPTPPRKRKVAFLTPAAVECLRSLDDLIHENRETSITYDTHSGKQQGLLGSLHRWQFPSINLKNPAEEDAARLPLRELWERWLAGRPKQQRDRDGLELLRALAWAYEHPDRWNKRLADSPEWAEGMSTLTCGLELPKLRNSHLVATILQWLLRLHPPAWDRDFFLNSGPVQRDLWGNIQPPAGAVDFLLDAVETAFALVPAQSVTRVINPQDWKERQHDWRADSAFGDWLTIA